MTTLETLVVVLAGLTACLSLIFAVQIVRWRLREILCVTVLLIVALGCGLVAKRVIDENQVRAHAH